MALTEEQQKHVKEGDYLKLEPCEEDRGGTFQVEDLRQEIITHVRLSNGIEMQLDNDYISIPTDAEVLEAQAAN